MRGPSHADRSDYKGRYRLPDLNADSNEILGYRDRHFNWYSVYRNRHMERMSRAVHYYIGHQWIELDREVLLETARGYTFRDIRSQGGIELPRPVTNFCGPAVDSEMATLNKRRLTPKVIASDRHPKTEAAAKVAQEVLDFRLKELDWEYHRDAFIWNTITTGTGFLKSSWDTPYSKLTRIGNPHAVSCPSCARKLSNRVVSAGMKDKIPNIPPSTEEIDDNGTPSLFFKHCPFCDAGAELKGFDVNPKQAEEEKDDLERPLGYNVPAGNTLIEAPSPFYMFPENSGVDVTPQNFNIMGQASVRSLDWIAERYPDRMDEVSAEEPEMLMEQHPILGEWHILGWYNSTLDSSIYEDHARVFEITAERNYRFPEGRHIVIAGDSTILDDGPLYRSHEGPDGESVSVPKVKYVASRFKVRAGEFWGHGLIDDIVSPQNRINGRDSQIIDATERMGSPNLLMSEGMELTGPEWVEEYGGGKLMTFIRDPLAPGEKPEVFGAITMPDGAFREREMMKEDMQFLAGPQPIQQGVAPKNVSTTSGLQLLGEQAELVSEPKLRDIEKGCQKIWEHQLKLVWVLRTDHDEYEVDTPTEGYLVKQFSNEDIAGQTRVKVEKQAFIEKSIYDREAAREAQADGLYNVESPLAKKKLLDYRGLPTDINEDESLQVDGAKRQWVEFTDEQKIPIIDESLHDPGIRWQTLGTFLLTNEGIRISEAANWPAVARVLGGVWELEMLQAEQADMIAREYYGPALASNPEMANQKYANDMLQYQDAMAAFNLQQQEMEAQQAAQAMLPPEQQQMLPMEGPLPPTPPPAPLFLPPSKGDRVLMVWKRILQRNPVPPPPEANTDPMMFMQQQELFLQFRAVVEAYRLLAQAQLSPPGMEPGMEGEVGTGTPADAPNPPNPQNIPNPGTSEALSNAGAV